LKELSGLIKNVLKKLTANKDLTTEEAYSVIEDISKDELSDVM